MNKKALSPSHVSVKSLNLIPHFYVDKMGHRKAYSACEGQISECHG